MAPANRESRILVTLDKDFGELAIAKRRPHSGIVRLVDILAREQGTYSLLVVERYHRELLDGAIITVQMDRIRIRPSINPGTQDHIVTHISIPKNFLTRRHGDTEEKRLKKQRS